MILQNLTKTSHKTIQKKTTFVLNSQSTAPPLNFHQTLKNMKRKNSYGKVYSCWERHVIRPSRGVLLSLFRCNGFFQRLQSGPPTFPTPDSPYKNRHSAKRPLSSTHFQLHHARFTTGRVFWDCYTSIAETEDSLRVVIVFDCYTHSPVHTQTRWTAWKSQRLKVRSSTTWQSVTSLVTHAFTATNSVSCEWWCIHANEYTLVNKPQSIVNSIKYHPTIVTFKIIKHKPPSRQKRVFLKREQKKAYSASKIFLEVTVLNINEGNSWK